MAIIISFFIISFIYCLSVIIMLRERKQRQDIHDNHILSIEEINGYISSNKEDLIKILKKENVDLRLKLKIKETSLVFIEENVKVNKKRRIKKLKN